jgi:hypothetical protein
MANNISVKDAAASTVTMKTTETSTVHTSHVNVDNIFGGTLATSGLATSAKQDTTAGKIDAIYDILSIQSQGISTFVSSSSVMGSATVKYYLNGSQTAPTASSPKIIRDIPDSGYSWIVDGIYFQDYTSGLAVNDVVIVKFVTTDANTVASTTNITIASFGFKVSSATHFHDRMFNFFPANGVKVPSDKRLIMEVSTTASTLPTLSFSGTIWYRSVLNT